MRTDESGLNGRIEVNKEERKIEVIAYGG